MNFKPHFFISLIIFHLLWLPLEELNYGFVWFWAFISALFPDSDLKLNKKHHRNVWTHLIILPMFLMIWDIKLSLMFGLAVSIHGILDISFSKKGGYYCLHFIKWRFNYKNTTLILIVQLIISLTLVWLL